MKRFRWSPFAVAAVLSLVLVATAQAQYADIQTAPPAGYGYVQPSYSSTEVYRLTTPAYSSSGYVQPSYTVTQPSYSYSYGRVYPQAGQGYNWQSRTSYATYVRTPTYSSGYGMTQPYYYAGQGWGTYTTGVMPNGASFRSWQPPTRIR
jgi:hypothetical protein